MKAQGIADKNGWARLESLQAYYSIAGRDLERDIKPMLEDQKMGLMVWSPLAGGILSGKFARDGQGPQGARRSNFDFPPVNRALAFDLIDAMRVIGKRYGASPARVALAWVLSRPFVTSVITGVKTLEQLNDNLAAADLKLTADEIAQLDTLSALAPEYPGWMVERQNDPRRNPNTK